MSKLDELIQELCPDGVEYKELQDVLKIKNGSDYKIFGEGNIPVYGSGGIIAYIDHFSYDKPSVLIPRKGSIDKLYYVDTPFWNVDTIFYTEINITLIHPRYLYHCLLREHLEKLNTAGGVPSLTQKVLNKVKIPVPPLKVQHEIVRILDNFTELAAELAAELTAELTARKKQYEYYRDSLLEYHENKSSMVAISALGKWSEGKTPATENREFWDNGTIPWISSKDTKISTLEDTEEHITEKALAAEGMTLYPAHTVAVATCSGMLKHPFSVVYVPFRATISQDIKILVVNDGISPRYVFHAIQAYSEDIRKAAKKHGENIDSLDFREMLSYKIPVPAHEIQKRLVHVLDNFDAVCSELGIGLQVEIEVQQKQYEFYRNALFAYTATGKIIQTDNETERYGLITLCQYVFGIAFVKLGDIASILRGASPRPIKNYITTEINGVNWIKIGDVPVGSKYVTQTAEKITKEGAIKSRRVKKGDFILSNSMSFGRPYILDIDGCIHDGWLSISGFDKFCIADFLYHTLSSSMIQREMMQKASFGGAVQNLNADIVKSIVLPIPSLEEQQHIVSTLNRFDTLCNDISSGLPAEIEARTKQYEYYRDKLLTFKKAENHSEREAI